jgi:hypothetical protein
MHELSPELAAALRPHLGVVLRAEPGGDGLLAPYTGLVQGSDQKAFIEAVVCPSRIADSFECKAALDSRDASAPLWTARDNGWLALGYKARPRILRWLRTLRTGRQARSVHAREQDQLPCPATRPGYDLPTGTGTISSIVLFRRALARTSGNR